MRTKAWDWSRADSFSPRWNRRAVAARPFIKGRCILDIGCGAPQFLRTVLPAGTEYLPADLAAWTPETEQCDLAAGRYPSSLARCDTVVLLGVLEYLADVPAALRGLSAAPAIVFSYKFGNEHNASTFTRWQAWRTLRSMGFRVTRFKKHKGHTIIRAVRGRNAWPEIFGLA